MSSQHCRNFVVEVNVIHKYMTGRAILFEAGSICPTEERDDIEAKNGMSPCIAQL